MLDVTMLGVTSTVNAVVDDRSKTSPKSYLAGPMPNSTEFPTKVPVEKLIDRRLRRCRRRQPDGCGEHQNLKRFLRHRFLSNSFSLAAGKIGWTVKQSSLHSPRTQKRRKDGLFESLVYVFEK